MSKLNQYDINDLDSVRYDSESYHITFDIIVLEGLKRADRELYYELMEHRKKACLDFQYA